MSAVDKCVRDDVFDPKGAPVGTNRSLGLGCLIFDMIILPRNTVCILLLLSFQETGSSQSSAGQYLCLFQRLEAEHEGYAKDRYTSIRGLVSLSKLSIIKSGA